MASPTAAAETELLQLVQVVHDTYVANLCTAAAATWLSYDILLTFSQEVELIWRAKWSFPKLLFFLVRYYTLVSLLLTLAVNTNHELSFTVCQGWRWYNGFNGTLLSAVVGEAIFLMRLYASYNRTKTILVTIVCLFLTEFVTGITTASLVVSSFSVTPRPADFPLPGCLFTPPKHVNLSTMVWAVAMSVTCVYFLLILYKFARNVSLRNVSGSSSTVPIWDLPRISPLVFSFLRDSAFYFFLVFLGNLLNLVFTIVFSGRALIPMGTIWLMVIYAISASRLCLNTRDSVYGNHLPAGWGDDIELDDRISGPSELSGTSISGILKRSGGDVSVQSGKLDVGMVDVLESNDGYYGSRADEVRSRDYEMESWLVVDSRGRARRMTHVIQSDSPRPL
ncbi:hypothetical protein BV20DRAFT_1125562 [Pilatotrama ljubarskyi]|nr:hypothetical protein BV20DRAFT_1125562 [Pilatotrama ljubarskyi]